MTMNIQADNGKLIQAPGQTAQTEAENNGLPFNQVPLGDGRIATIRRAKGRDLINAERLAGESAITLGFALAGICTSIDEKPLPYEDFLDMDLADCQKITERYTKLMGNSPFPAPRT